MYYIVNQCFVHEQNISLGLPNYQIELDQIEEEYSIDIQIRGYETADFIMLIPETADLSDNTQLATTFLNYGIYNLKNTFYQVTSDDMALIANNIIVNPNLFFLPTIDSENNDSLKLLTTALFHIQTNQVITAAINYKNLHWMFFACAHSLNNIQCAIIDSATSLHINDLQSKFSSMIYGSKYSDITVNIEKVTLGVQDNDYSCGFWVLACLEKTEMLLDKNQMIDFNQYIQDIQEAMYNLDIEDYKDLLLARLTKQNDEFITSTENIH